MNILFMGTPEFAVPSLRKLIESEHNVCALVCQPDKPRGRSKKLISPPTKVLAEQNSIEIIQPEKIKTEEFHCKLKSINPDLIAVVAYGKILPKNILELPRYKCVNVHASLLPKYRGAAPINWAIVRGEPTTGVTTMLMDVGMDTGDILLKEEIKIEDNHSSIELTEKLSTIGADLLLETINKIQSNKIVPIKQNNNEATMAPLMKKEDGRIDWNSSAKQIRNLIRGMQPWPNAHTTFEGKNLKIFKAEVKEGSGTPGEIISVDKNNLLIATGNNLLSIQELQIEGSKRMNIQSFLSGKKLSQNQFLGT